MTGCNTTRMSNETQAPLDLSRIRVIANSDPAVDPGLLEMLPDPARELLAEGPAALNAMGDMIAQLQHQISAKDQHLADINAALQEYAINTGQGQIMFNDIRLCLEQVKMRREQGKK